MSDESFMHAAGESHLRSTYEGSEQRSARIGGGAGGKADDQGEHRRVQSEPDTETGDRVTRT